MGGIMSDLTDDLTTAKDYIGHQNTFAKGMIDNCIEGAAKLESEKKQLSDALRKLLKQFRSSRIGYQREMEKQPGYDFEECELYSMFMEAEKNAVKALEETK